MEKGIHEISESTLLYVMFTCMKGLGPVGQHELLRFFDSIEECFAADEAALRSISSPGVPKRCIDIFTQTRLDTEIRERAIRIVETCIREDIRIVTAEDSSYPLRMRSLPDIPVVIYVKGSLRINNYIGSVGVVGARRCSREGRQAAIEISERAINAGKAIISGMAKGIDSYAHTAAIRSHGYTVAVLGSGPDICYPSEHEKLYRSIINNGCILSEYPPGTKPDRYMFPKRNRIIAALSDELYVIDTGRRSGTASTVEAANRYNREVIRI